MGAVPPPPPCTVQPPAKPNGGARPRLALQDGCGMPDNSTLAPQECQLLASAECAVGPTVVARGTADRVDPALVSGAQRAARS